MADVNPEAGAVDEQVDRPMARDRTTRDLAERLEPPGQRRVVGNGDLHVKQVYQGMQEAFGLSQRKLKDHADRQSRLNRDVRVDALATGHATGEGPRDRRSEPHQLARALVVDGPQALHGLVFSRRGISQQSATERGELPPEVQSRRPPRANRSAHRFVCVAQRVPDRLLRQHWSLTIREGSNVRMHRRVGDAREPMGKTGLMN
jgi:hypothetical protein